MKNIVASLLVFVFIIGAIPVTAATKREIWVPMPSITCGVTEDEVSINKAIHMGVARLYKLDQVGDNNYLAVLERKYSDGGTNGNRDHSDLYYYSLLETDDSFIVLGRAFLYNEYVQNSLEEVADISSDIDIDYYESQGYEAPIYIVNPNGKYTCTSWDEANEFVLIGSNGGIAEICDFTDYAQARTPIIFENKFCTGRTRYVSSNTGYFYYLSDGSTRATLIETCGIKNGSLVAIKSSKIATTQVTPANGYVSYPDEGYTGNVKVDAKYLISKEKNLYLSYVPYLNDSTGLYDYMVTVNKVIDGKVTLVNKMTFCTDSARDPVYKPYIITGLDREKYTSQNIEIPAMLLGKVFVTENGNFYELTPEANIGGSICIYNGMLSYIRTYVDGAYLRYYDENGVNQYWQRINTLNFNKGKATISSNIDLLVGAHDNLDGYFSTYKSFVACTGYTAAKVTSISGWWTHYLDNKFSDGRYISGHWVANEAGSYEIWYDIYDENDVKISTGPSGYSIGASGQRYCPKVRFFVINDTKVILTVDDLEYDWIEEYYRASVVTENDEGIVEIPMPIGKKNITPPDSADTTPTEDVVDFAADNLELGFNVKENVLGTENLNPELREQVNTVRLDGIVILKNKNYISGKQNTGITLKSFDEYDDSFGNTSVRFYSNGQYLCWYCDEPEKLKEGTYNVSYNIGDLNVCAIVKVIAPPTNDSATTVVF